MIELDHFEELAKIRVIGVGGCGGNAINNMIAKGLDGVKFISANTDKQVLENNLAQVKIHMGKETTKGLGAGGNPEIGNQAANESFEELKESLKGSDMIFITAGMGGGTGTGAAPVIAKLGQELGSLVVAIVTKPFMFEGRRYKLADGGIKELRQYVDALIVIPNEKLLAISDKKVTIKNAYLKADDVLFNATRGISDIITQPGLVNVDFADVRTVMKGMGDALMGTGIATGENRAIEATQNALNSPLLDGITIAGAQGVLVNITGSEESTTLHEISEAISIIQEAAGDDVNLIHGVVLTPEPMDELMVTIVATGFKTENGKTKAMSASNGVKTSAPVELPFPTISNNQYQKTESRLDTYPKTTFTIASPRGTQALKDLEVPAYVRRVGHDNPDNFEKGMSSIEQLVESEPTMSVIEDNGSSINMNQPRFIRKMMD
jgi:cell division protein FtsZ